MPLYRETAGTVISGKRYTAWISEGLDDPGWDQFLQTTPLGQFHQATLWARLKALDGWKAKRMTITADQAIVGGFQALTRGSGWRKEGYVTKGPVLLPEHAAAGAYLTGLLREFSKREKLAGMLVQLPDLGADSLPLPDADFPLFTVRKIQDATWMVDVSRGWEAVSRDFNKTTRSYLKKGANFGFVSREAGREELGVFTDLMLQTCARLGVQPNPGGLEHIQALWDAAPQGSPRLFFVEHSGRPVAGELCLGFGATMGLFKTGSLPEYAEHHPTEFSVASALRHACEGGSYQFCDFGSFNTSIARKILSGEAWERSELDGRHGFHMKFGGFPRLLPPARVYLLNPAVRWGYKAFSPLLAKRKRRKDAAA